MPPRAKNRARAKAAPRKKAPLKTGGLSRARGMLFVDARQVPRLTNQRLAQQFHNAGHIKAVKRQGRGTTVMQPMKRHGYKEPFPTRNIEQKVTVNGKPRVLVSKGTGTQTFSEFFGDSEVRRQLFSHESGESLLPRKFWGGMRLAEAEHNHYFAQELRRAFENAKRNKDKAYLLAHEYGVDKAPTMEVVSVTMPNRNIIHVSELTQKEMRKLLASRKLSAKEKNALRFLAQKAKEIKGDRATDTDAVKLRKALEILGVPKEFRGKQAVMNYLVETNERAERFFPYPPKITIQQVAALMGAEKKGSKWRFNGMLLTERDLKKAYLLKFAASVGLGTYLMQRKLNGTFSTEVGGSISSLTPQNITLAGEIIDLDTAQTGIGRNKMQRLQAEDMRHMGRAIREIAAGLNLRGEETAANNLANRITNGG